MSNFQNPIVDPEKLIPQEESSVAASNKNHNQKDSRFFSIGALPSGYAPYDFDELMIRPFSFVELKLLSRAAQTKTDMNVVHAVNNCVSEDAFNLTVGDFYYVLFWLRVNSYPKTPWTVSWTCRNVLEDEEEQRLCGASNISRISSSSVEILPLEKTELPEGIDFPRAKHLDDIQDLLKDPDTRYLVKEIQWIAGDSIPEKIRKLESSESLDLFEAAKQASDDLQHGIVETIQLKCKECGGLHSHKMTINPLTFFR